MDGLALHNFSSPGLQPFSLELQPGQCITLSGPSGCGKTRLLRAIADLDPNAGTIALADLPRNRIAPTDWRRQVGYLPAESHWWGEKVSDHFADQDSAELEILLSALGFSSEVMNWEIARLSSGERQRLALARLLIGNPKVLLLDEPTANLDQENIERVEALLTQYRTEHHTALLWVSHDRAQRQRVAQAALRFHKDTLESEPWS
jgi:ABC-type iron transport system FetAB ATPase subunit